MIRDYKHGITCSKDNLYPAEEQIRFGLLLGQTSEHNLIVLKEVMSFIPLIQAAKDELKRREELYK